jgi:hypothetical protein
MSAASTNRQARSEAAQSAESAKARAAGQAIGGIITAAKGAMNALPPPANIAASALADAVYAFLTGKPLPINMVLALLPDQAKKDIDPIFLFAIGIAFAIIEALWCFIKALLHPLPIIGMFFPLCDDDNRPGPAGAPVANPDKAAKNAADAQLARTLAAIGQPDNPPTIPAKATPVIPVRPVPAGITFGEFVSKNASVASRKGQAQNPPITTKTNTNNSANVLAAPAVPTPYTYEEGNLSSEQARRLFGL